MNSNIMIFKTIKSAIILIVGLLFLTSCSNTAVFKPSSKVPAATGTAKTKEMKNGNYSVQIEVLNLALPANLKPSKKYYVVWVKTSEGTFNIGRLPIDNDLKGTLEAESTYKPKLVLISAEDDEKASKVGKLVVLKTKRF